MPNKCASLNRASIVPAAHYGHEPSLARNPGLPYGSAQKSAAPAAREALSLTNASRPHLPIGWLVATDKRRKAREQVRLRPHSSAQPRSRDDGSLLRAHVGAEVIRTVKNGQTRIDLKLGGADIFIAPVAPGSGVNPPPTTPYQGLDHFGLRVTNIEAVVADLKAKGAEFTMELNEFRPGTHICFIRGPEGVSIEVLERKPV